ncbi:MAG: hypothetical protein ACYCYK_00460 [Candidatus Dormibacteria bacterium]
MRSPTRPEVNLRQIFNRPPFLFVRGALGEPDARVIAMVGSWQASARGQHLRMVIRRRGLAPAMGIG